MLLELISSFGERVDLNYLLALFVQSGQGSGELWGMDLSIESLRSQRFSRGIFGFLLVSLLIFAFIIYLYLPKDKKQLKTGEKVMFGAIIFGMILAVILGWIQLIEGYLV